MADDTTGEPVAVQIMNVRQVKKPGEIWVFHNSK